MRISPTLPLHAASGQAWDAVVIGAGPAGATSALDLARLGARVLLVDRATFPRPKVCGCCLNLSAFQLLDQLGLGRLPVQQRARVLRQVLLCARGRRIALRLPGGFALSREALDSALIRRAIECGAAFLPGTAASLGETTPESRMVRLQDGAFRSIAAARVVILADGLGGLSLSEEDGGPARVQADSRVGVGAVHEKAPRDYEPGVFYMACGAQGYVGLVRLEDDRLNLAGALDGDWMRAEGGAARAVERLLVESGLPKIKHLAGLPWRSTPPLSQRAGRVSGQRLLLLGDAAGHVEPFTGEGIAWAMTSALAASPVVLRAAAGWSDAVGREWEERYAATVLPRQRFCRRIAGALRRPWAFASGVFLLSRMPWLARPVVRRLNAPARI